MGLRDWLRGQRDLATLPALLRRGEAELTGTERFYNPRGTTIDTYWNLAAQLIQPRGPDLEIVLPLVTILSDAGGEPRYREVRVANAVLAAHYLPLGLWELPSLRPLEDVHLQFVDERSGYWRLTARQYFRWQPRTIPAHLAQQQRQVREYATAEIMSEQDAVWYRHYRDLIGANALPRLSALAISEQAAAEQQLAKRVQRLAACGAALTWIVPRA